jgi:DNA-binding transcriptional regulator GbsR (MarR family)
MGIDILSPKVFSFDFNLNVLVTGEPADSSPVTSLFIPVEQRVNEPYLLSLLNWRTRISEFAGREEEHRELAEWAYSEPVISMKFICGPGGSGKTRLAAHVAEQLVKEGWAAGFIRPDQSSKFHLGEKGTLVIIDYPEEYPVQVPALFRNLADYSSKKHRLRVLFLTRQLISSWVNTISENKAIGILEKTPVIFSHLNGEEAHRIYVTALGEASERLQTPPPKGVSVDALAGWLEKYPDHNRPLFILAAAIHNALHPEENFLRYTSADVVLALADREIDRLNSIARTNHIGKAGELIKIVTLATLGDGLRYDQIPGIENGDELEDKLLNAGILTNGMIPPLKPDIPAAAFVVRALSNDSNAPDVLWECLSDDIDNGLKRLARLNHDAEVECGIRDFRLRHCLENAISGNLERSERLFNALTTEPPLGLLNACIKAGEALLKYIEEPKETARIWNNISIVYSRIGDRDSAIKAVQEAVEIYRKLAEAEPAAYLMGLAMSLNNLAGRLSENGDRKGALEAIQEAVEINRKLAEADPAAYLTDLARSLNNLSNHLNENGDRKGALEAIQEAVEIYRKLPEEDPVVYLADLAMSLNTLSKCLSNTGDRKGALEAIQEAVEIYRKLAEAEPAVYLTGLAKSLNILSNRLSNTGDRKGALEAIREAVEIRRKLAEAEPAAYLPDLAISLNNLAGCLNENGDRKGALEAIQEAVEIRRKLAEAEPAAYLPDFAMSLNNLSVSLNENGDRKSALEVIQEAVEIYRKLAEAEPAAYMPDFAMSLNILSVCLGKNGDVNGALEVIQEAVEIYRKLAEAEPAAYLPDLAMSLNNLSVCLSENGDRKGALEAIQEAVEIRRKLAEAEPAAYLPDLAKSLNNFSNRLSENGDMNGALEVIQEAVELYRKLAESEPAAYLGYLVRCMHNLHLLLENEGNEKAIRKLQAEFQDVRVRMKHLGIEE